MQYTVKEFGGIVGIVGISTRTIRYYDEIGLLKPSFINKAGYRIYTDVEKTDLLLIEAYKEAGYKLSEICSCMQLENGDRIASLSEVLGRLEKRKDELSRLDEKISDKILMVSNRRKQKS